MEIGRRIYWDILTGEVLVNTGERAGDVIETTIEQDFERYSALTERVPETVGVIELDYGQFAEDFQVCNGYRVDPVTKEILFSYPDPEQPEKPPIYQKPLTVQLAEVKADLEEKDRENKNAIFEIYGLLYLL